MWNAIKGRKRCVVPGTLPLLSLSIRYHHLAYTISLDLGVSTDVLVMGYYEWLKKGKDKIPHFTKRGDAKIMLLAGLWNSVQYEGPPPPGNQLLQNTPTISTHLSAGFHQDQLMIGTDERIYSYTIITTSSAKSVSFLHDRMPVILEPESEGMRKWLDPNEPWSMDLAKILKPYEGELTWSALTIPPSRSVPYNYPSFAICSSCSPICSF